MTAFAHPKTQPAPGTRIVRGMSFAEYAHEPSLNASLTKHLLRSPAHYQAALKHEQEETLDQRLGQAVHAWVLTGQAPEVVIRPDCRPLGDGTFDTADKWHGGKDWCKKWRGAQTLPILTQEERDREFRMCDAIADDELACAALAACPEREVSVFATYRGVPLKARLDAANFEAALIADLKKGRDTSPEGFGRAADEYGYLLSCAWYRRIFLLVTGRWPQWAWISVEDSPAACVTVYRPTDDHFRIGEQQMERALDVFIECQEKKEWPGYSRGAQQFLQLPAWAMRQHEALLLR